jgi:hypothetical protein
VDGQQPGQLDGRDPGGGSQLRGDLDAARVAVRFWTSAVRRSDDLEENWIITSLGLACWATVLVAGATAATDLIAARNLDAALALVDDGDVGPSLAGIVSPTMGAIALAGAVAVAVSTCNRLWFAPVGSAVQALTVSAVVGTVGLALVNRPDLLLASTSPNGATAVTWGASAVRGLPLVALVALSLRLERVRRAPARSPHGGGSAPL